MSRFAHFTRGLSASWMATVIVVFYGLASVPIALRYLTVDEFGLFMLVMQIAGYFSLVELGMSGATARILIDYKDQKHSGNYGSVILTSSLVFTIQALIIIIVGFLGVPWIIKIVGVEEKFSDIAIYLLRWLCFTFAFGISLRAFSSLLYANQRLDILNIVFAVSTLIGLAIMTLILVMGGGLRGLVIMFILQAIANALLMGLACWRLRLFPENGSWGRPTWSRFKELFLLAKDFFLINIGSQVLEASQLIIVTRTMGLSAAAIWSVSTKVFAMALQLLAKIQGTAVVFLAEMMVRGETHSLEVRYRQIFQSISGLAVIALSVAVAINNPFVTAWAKPDLAWGMSLSALLALSVFLNVTSRCHTDFIIHTKQIKALRYIYFFEAAAFVVLAVFLSRQIGFYGVLLSSILCTLLIRLSYAIFRIANYFDLRLLTICWLWPRRSLLSACTLIPFVVTAGVVAGLFNFPWLKLTIASVWIGIPAALNLALISLPKDVRKELQARLLRIFARKTQVSHS